MSPRGISMEELNGEWGEGCAIDGTSCLGCGDCDDGIDDDGPWGFHAEGCCFPGECCMPGDHFKSECFTAEMAEVEMVRLEAEQKLEDLPFG